VAESEKKKFQKMKVEFLTSYFHHYVGEK